MCSSDLETVANSLPILFVDGQNKGPLTNAVVLSNAAKSYAPKDKVLVSASAIKPFEEASESEILDHLEKLFGVSTTNWNLIKKYEIKDALPAMLPPYSLIDSNKLNESLFIAGDHRATSSINGAFLSGRNTAISVKVSLGI